MNRSQDIDSIIKEAFGVIDEIRADAEELRLHINPVDDSCMMVWSRLTIAISRLPNTKREV